MKSYKERTMDILDKRDTYFKKRKKTHMIIYAACSVAACTVITFGVLDVLDVLGVTNIAPKSFYISSDEVNLAEEISAPVNIEAQSSQENDTSPILYSQLALTNCKSANYSDIVSSDSTTEFNIISFNESLIENCCAILEGTVSNIYNKEYSYETPYNKFGTSGVMHSKMTSVIYEIKVNKVWYGSDDFAEKTYLIEDVNRAYFFDEMSSLKVGGKYVLPIYISGKSISIPVNSTSDNMTRDTQYSTNYPYHPQIQVTDDNKYIITTDWPTLLESGCQEIMLDDKASDNPKGTSNFYVEKMRLVSKSNFTKQMEKLISLHLK